MKTKLWIFTLLVTIMSIQAKAQAVKVNGRQLIVTNQRYRINGVCYSRGGFGNYTQDIALMKEANINTIRTYSPINDKAELDAFANAGIRIIMHLDENNYEGYINTYKSHSAILMWEFGNEFNYHPEWFGGNINTWYSKLQACAIRAHQLDTNHPVTTAHGEVPTAAILSTCSAVDVWGMNLYRYDNDVPALTDFAARSSKAMYVSECGGDSYNKASNQIREDQQMQANRNIVNGIIGKYDICIGVTVFEFCDEWWKAGNDAIQNPGGSAPNSSGVPYDGSADEEYWGIVRRDRSKKPAFTDLKAIYGSVTPNPIVGRKIEAEAYNSMLGVKTEACSEGGSNVGYIDTNDWMAYNSVNFATTGTYTFEFRVASPSGAQLSADLNAGTIQLGSVAIPATGGWQNWQTVKFTANVNAGTYNLGVFAKTGGWNINWIQITPGLKALHVEDLTEAVETSTTELLIYPVPVTNELTIHFGNEASLLTIQITNMNGESLKQTQMENNSTIDVSSLLQGVYVIKATKNNEIGTKLFIKK